jgi:hypothetical protein
LLYNASREKRQASRPWPLCKKASRQQKEHRANHSHADQLDGEEDKRRKHKRAVFAHGSNKLILCLVAALKLAPYLAINRIAMRSHLVLFFFFIVIIIPLVPFKFIIRCSLVI